MIRIGVLLYAALSMASAPAYPTNSPQPLLPLTFAHRDHTSVHCADCHHNFIDATGQGLCFECHQTNEEIAPLIEEHFHGLCRDCHVEKHLASEKTGPTRHCSACHQRDNQP